MVIYVTIILKARHYVELTTRKRHPIRHGSHRIKKSQYKNHSTIIQRKMSRVKICWHRHKRLDQAWGNTGPHKMKNTRERAWRYPYTARPIRICKLNPIAICVATKPAPLGAVAKLQIKHYNKRYSKHCSQFNWPQLMRLVEPRITSLNCSNHLQIKWLVVGLGTYSAYSLLSRLSPRFTPCLGLKGTPHTPLLSVVSASLVSARQTRSHIFCRILANFGAAGAAARGDSWAAAGSCRLLLVRGTGEKRGGHRENVWGGLLSVSSV